MALQAFLVAVVQLSSFPIFCAYMLMVALARPWTRFIPQLNLKMVLACFNLACCLISLYTFLGIAHVLITEGNVYSTTDSDRLKWYLLVYWLTKALELLDTVFIIVRHRLRQLSFLHVFHHGSMLLLSDYTYHFSPYPPIALIFGINSLVHVCMYLHYAVSVLYPSVPRMWRQRLTEIQILQFVIGLVFSVEGYRSHGFCKYSLWYGTAMTGLFFNFYYHAYLKEKPKHGNNHKKD